MIAEPGDDEDHRADGENAGGEREDTLTGGCAEKGAEGAAEEEVVGAGEGGGVGEIEVVKPGAQSYEDDAECEDCCAGDEGEGDECLEALDSIDEKRPDEIELLLDLERPEVVDVERVQIERADGPEGEVGGVGQIVDRPA